MNGRPLDQRRGKRLRNAFRQEVLAGFRLATQARIVAFGDVGFASNRYLRALYNLDLLMNGIHWSAEREAQITIRPKIRDTVQFPLPVENSLQMLYGVGLLVPEVLLMVGGVVWLRRRGA